MAGIIEVLGGALGSGGAGAVVGGVLGVVNRAVGVWERKEARRDQELANAEAAKVRGHELELIKIQQSGQREETEDELQIRQASLMELAAKLDGEGLIAALADQTAAVSRAHPWVADVLALARLGITVALFTGMMGALAYTLFPACTAALQDEIVTSVIKTITFAGNLALCFWFGARPEKGAGK